MRPAESERALLERLPQLVEDIPAEFPQLIEEEHAAVGQGQFPRSRCAAAPPKRAALEQLWCGLRKGRALINPLCCSSSPATE